MTYIPPVARREVVKTSLMRSPARPSRDRFARGMIPTVCMEPKSKSALRKDSLPVAQADNRASDNASKR